jgi:hypothetical protein
LAWETRNGRGRYYTRSRRINGQVVREYYGTGLVGSTMARIDERKQARRRQWQAQRQRLDEIDRPINNLNTLCTSLMHIALHAAGFHRHHCGEWRKRMNKPKQKSLTQREKTQIDKLFEQAGAGDHEALAELKTFDERLPAEYVAQLIHQHGNTGECVERYLIGFIAGEDLVKREALHRAADTLRAKLAGPNPSPLESVLIGRIVVSDLHVDAAQIWCAASEFREVGGRAEECLQRRLSYAHQRFLQACKALAQVRKLLGPSIQVNIAEKQINLLGKAGS